MTYGELQERVRKVVKDLQNLEWDATLVKDYINEGYREFFQKSHYLVKSNVKLPLSASTATFTTFDDIIQINRIEWDNNSLPVTTSFNMDNRVGEDWRVATASGLQAVIRDSEGYNTIRVYPMLSSSQYAGTTVYGTNGNVYYCTANHTSSTDDTPITGSDYSDYWTVLNGTWAASTEYTCGTWVIGTDTKPYQCIVNHKANTSNDKPITGTNYAAYWSQTPTPSTWAVSTSYYEWHPLVFDYAYMPRDMVNTADEPALPDFFHKAFAEYAIAQCQLVEAGKNRDTYMSNIHYQKFLEYVGMARQQTDRGFINNKGSMVLPRRWL